MSLELGDASIVAPSPSYGLMQRLILLLWAFLHLGHIKLLTLWLIEYCAGAMHTMELAHKELSLELGKEKRRQWAFLVWKLHLLLGKQTSCKRGPFPPSAWEFVPFPTRSCELLGWCAHAPIVMVCCIMVVVCVVAHSALLQWFHYMCGNTC